MEVYSNIQVDMLSSCCRTYSNIVPLQNAFWLPCVTPATAGPAELCEKKTYLLTALSISKGTYVYINYACFSCCQPLTAQCPRPRTLTSSSNICPFHTGSFSFRFFFGCGWFGLLPLAASLLAASAAASAAAALTLASVFAVFRVGIASCS